MMEEISNLALSLLYRLNNYLFRKILIKYQKPQLLFFIWAPKSKSKQMTLWGHRWWEKKYMLHFKLRSIFFAHYIIKDVCENCVYFKVMLQTYLAAGDSTQMCSTFHYVHSKVLFQQRIRWKFFSRRSSIPYYAPECIWY